MHASTNQKIKTDVYSRDIAIPKDSHGKALDENNQSTVHHFHYVVSYAAIF